jgi:hypothetical protein
VRAVGIILPMPRWQRQEGRHIMAALKSKARSSGKVSKSLGTVYAVFTIRKAGARTKLNSVELSHQRAQHIAGIWNAINDYPRAFVRKCRLVAEAATT